MLNGRVFIFKDWVSNGHWMLRFESATLPPEVQAWTDAKGDESILSEPVRATLKKQVANRTFSPEDAETPKNVIPSDANVPYSFSRRVSDADGDTHVEFTSTLEGTQPIYLANDYTKAFKITGFLATPQCAKEGDGIPVVANQGTLVLMPEHLTEGQRIPLKNLDSTPTDDVMDMFTSV